MKAAPERALDRLPHGYEVREGLSGRVTIGLTRPRQIHEIEESLVRDALQRLRPNAYACEVRGKSITIYASAHDGKCFAESLDAEFSAGFAAALEEILERKFGKELADYFRAERMRRDGDPKPRRFYPLLRFELVDERRRAFQVKRIYFSGDQDWLALERLPLTAAVLKYVPHLGRESFFGLL